MPHCRQHAAYPLAQIVDACEGSVRDDCLRRPTTLLRGWSAQTTFCFLAGFEYKHIVPMLPCLDIMRRSYVHQGTHLMITPQKSTVIVDDVRRACLASVAERCLRAVEGLGTSLSQVPRCIQVALMGTWQAAKVLSYCKQTLLRSKRLKLRASAL